MCKGKKFYFSALSAARPVSHAFCGVSGADALHRSRGDGRAAILHGLPSIILCRITTVY